MASSVLIILVIKTYLLKSIRKKQAGKNKYILNPTRLMFYDFGVWLILSVCISLFNMFVFEFPIQSGGKLMVGFITLGIYSSISTMLEEDKLRIETLSEWREEHEPQKFFISLVNKFLIFIFGTLLLLATILTLLFQNDFIFMVNYYQETNIKPTIPILKHIFYVFFVMFSGIIILGYKYAKNLKLVLNLQLDSYSKVLYGNYDHHIPVITNDELGIIANATNKIVKKLRKEKTENLQLYKESISDKLTGLYNRRYFDETIEKEIGLCRRDKDNQLSLLIIDIDHFKLINDKYGHDAGDYVLKRASECISGSIRKTDLAFRFGGEEFCVLMSGSNIENTNMVATKILNNFQDMTICYEKIKIKITVSIGISSLNNNINDAKTLIKAADIALYEAKSAGRNQVSG